MKTGLVAFILVFVSGLLFAQGADKSAGRAKPDRGFSVVEASIPEMQAAMREGRVTSRGLGLQYLTRIALYNRQLHAILTVNRNALQEAEELDRERARGHVRGPLHGIPIALKDNIQTTDMPTTGGGVGVYSYFPSHAGA